MGSIGAIEDQSKAFPKDSPLVSEVSRAILKLLESDKMVEIENNLYDNRSCPTQEENATNSNRLSFQSFWGLFLITGAASMAALLLHLAQFLYKHREFFRNSDPENSAWRKLVLMAELYDRMELESNRDGEEKEEPGEERAVEGATPRLGDVMSPSAISAPLTPSSLSTHGMEAFESEDEMEDSSDGELSGRELRRQNPDPPSFADMIVARDQGDT